MDESQTAPFTATPSQPNGAAVLLLHGFTGSPWEIRPLGDALVARGYAVVAPRLPGHGTSPEAMAWVTHRDWEQAADDALLSLSKYRHVFVAGLSMGALLSLILAARHPQLVKGLVLMAPAWRFKAWDVRLSRFLRFGAFDWLGHKYVPKHTTDIEDPEARAMAPVMGRFPVGRLNDLFIVQEHARKCLGDVVAPTLVVASYQDHVVSLDGVHDLHEQLRGSRLLLLRQGFHILPRDKDRALLAAEVGAFLDAQLK